MHEALLCEEFLPTHLRVTLSDCSSYLITENDSSPKQDTSTRPLWASSRSGLGQQPAWGTRLENSWSQALDACSSPSKSYSEAVGEPFALGLRPSSGLGSLLGPRSTARAQQAGAHHLLSPSGHACKQQEPGSLAPAGLTVHTSRGLVGRGVHGATLAATPCSTSTPPLPPAVYPDMGSATAPSEAMRPPWAAPLAAAPPAAPLKTAGNSQAAWSMPAQHGQDASPTSQTPVYDSFDVASHRAVPGCADSACERRSCMQPSTPFAAHANNGTAPCTTRTHAVVSTSMGLHMPAAAAPPAPCAAPSATNSASHHSCDSSEADSVATMPSAPLLLQQQQQQAMVVSSRPQQQQAMVVAAGLPAPSSSCGNTSAEDLLSDEDGTELGAGSKRPRAPGAKVVAAASGVVVAGGVRMACLNCGATQTPQWRCGPQGPRTLCNRCGVAYKKGRSLDSIAPIGQDKAASTDNKKAGGAGPAKKPRV